MCISLNLVSYVFLLIKEGISKSTKSKGGIEGSMTRPVVDWVCYNLVSDLLVETVGRYRLGLLVRVSRLRSNSDRKVEKLRRNGVAEYTHELYRHRSIVRVLKDHDHPPSNWGVIVTVGLGEIWDTWIRG
jgi:hypothetical protein